MFHIDQHQPLEFHPDVKAWTYACIVHSTIFQSRATPERVSGPGVLEDCQSLINLQTRGDSNPERSQTQALGYTVCLSVSVDTL